MPAYLPRMYGGYGGAGGMLPEMSFQPMQLGQVQQEADQYQAEKTLAPEELEYQQQALQQKTSQLPLQQQEAEESAQLKKAGFGNDMLAQVARDAQAADPSDAPMIWDKGMKRLSDQGIDAAGQYIGNYRQDLAQRVGDVYSGRAQAEHDQNQSQNFNATAAFAAIQKMPLADRQKALQNQNAAIEGFNNVHDEQSWKDELAKLSQVNPQIAQMFPPGADWRYQYGVAHKLLQSITPMRDMIAQSVISEATGAPAPEPLPFYGKGAAGLMGYSVTGYTADHRPIYTQKGNPENTYVGGVPGGYGAKPSAGMELYDQKKADGLSVGMSDADAIAFANGKKTPSDSELANMAAERANQELGDATLAMQQIADPTAYVNQREQYWYNLYKHPNAGGGAVPKASTTGARGGAPAGQWKTMSTSDQQASLANARAAIKRNPGSRQAVLQRLQAAGAPTQGL